MKTKDTLKRASAKLGDNVVLEGLLRMNGRLKNNLGSQPSDVVGFDYLVHHEDSCYEYYEANPPLIGLTQPVPVLCPVGIMVFDEYKVDYIEAIKIFHSGNWGSYFTSIVLCKPLVYPPAEEPLWYFMSDTHVCVVIGANSGNVLMPK